MRVLIVDPIDPSGITLLSAKAEVVLCKEAALDGIRRDARESDTIITRSRLPDDIFEAAPRRLRHARAWQPASHGPVACGGASRDARATGQKKTIAGAMLDGYEHYRLEPGHPLLTLENAVLTPHLAGMTQESRKRMGAAAAEETLRMLAGERPLKFVNPEVWNRFNERRSEDR